MADNELQFKITVTNQLSEELKKTASAADKLTSQISGIGSAFTKVAAAYTAFRFIKNMISDSSELQKSLIGLEGAAAASGQNVGKLLTAAKELSKDGLIPLTETSRSLKNLLASGLSADESIKLFKAFRDSAAFGRQGQLELGAAIAGATDGFKNQLSSLTDNAGMTTNITVLQKDYAKSIHTTIGALSQSQKIHGAYVGFMKEGQRTTGDYEKLLNTFDGRLSQVNGSWKLLSAELGDFITTNPYMIGALKTVASALQIIRDNVLKNKEAWTILANTGASTVIDSLKLMLNASLIAAKGFLTLGKTIQDAFNPSDFRLRTQLANLQRQLEGAKGMGGSKEEIAGIEKQIKIYQIAITSKEGNESDIKYQKQIDALSDLQEKLSELKVEEIKDLTTHKDRKKVVNEEELKVQSDQIKKQRLLIAENIFKAGFDANIFSKLPTEMRLQMEKAFTKLEQIDLMKKFDLGKMAGVFANIMKGAAGAREMISGSAAGFVDGIIPGSGQVVKPVMDALMQGPEYVKAMVNEFADAIPILIENLILAIPQLVESFFDAFPRIVEKLMEMLGRKEFWERFIQAIMRAGIAFLSSMPQAALSFVVGLIKGIPEIVSGIASGVYEALKEILSKINPFGSNFAGTGGGFGSFLSNGIGAIGDVFGFAEGGLPNLKGVPSGFSGDKFPARLNSGELIVDHSTTNELKQFLKNPVQDNSETNTLLSMIMNLLEQPQMASADVQFNSDTLAKIMISLDRRGARTK